MDTVCALATAIMLQGCATAPETGQPIRTTATEKAIGKCVASVAVGAIGGALIGAALETDGMTTQSIVTRSGRAATVRTRVTPAPAPKPKQAARPKKKQMEAPVSPQPEQTTEARDVTGENEATGNADDVILAENGADTGDVPVLPAAYQTPDTQPETSTKISEVAYFEEKPDATVCRFTELFVDMEGQTADAGKQKWCRSGDGAWQPVAG